MSLSGRTVKLLADNSRAGQGRAIPGQCRAMQGNSRSMQGNSMTMQGNSRAILFYLK